MEMVKFKPRPLTPGKESRYPLKSNLDKTSYNEPTLNFVVFLFTLVHVEGHWDKDLDGPEVTHPVALRTQSDKHIVH